MPNAFGHARFGPGALTLESAGGSVWLKNWSEINGDAGSNPHVGKYIGIYFAFGFGNAALVVMQTLILWIFCSIEVSENTGFSIGHDIHLADCALGN